MAKMLTFALCVTRLSYVTHVTRNSNFNDSWNRLNAHIGLYSIKEISYISPAETDYKLYSECHAYVC